MIEMVIALIGIFLTIVAVLVGDVHGVFVFALTLTVGASMATIALTPALSYFVVTRFVRIAPSPERLLQAMRYLWIVMTHGIVCVATLTITLVAAKPWSSFVKTVVVGGPIPIVLIAIAYRAAHTIFHHVRFMPPLGETIYDPVEFRRLSARARWPKPTRQVGPN